MSKKVKVDPNQKEFLVLKFKELNISLSKFCRVYNVDRTAIIRWSIKYELGGKDVLFEITNRTLYSAHTLINSVTDYLSGKFSMLDIVKKYNLSSDNVLRTWLKWYNTPKWNIKVGEFMAREKISKALRQYKKSTEQKDAENVLSLMASAVQASDPELSDPEKRRLFRLCLDGISKRHMRTFFDEKFLDYDDYTEFVRWAKEEYGEIVPLGGFPEDTVNPLRPPEVRQYTREEMEKLADEFCAAMSFSL